MNNSSKVLLAALSAVIILVFLICRPAEKISFGVISDIQYCDYKASGTRFYKNSLDKTVEVVNELNKKDLAFTIHLGDLIDRDVKSYDSIMPIVRKLNMPIYFAYGNHDYNIQDNFKSSIDSIHQQKKSYYSFTKANWRFIVLNTNDISSYAYPTGSERAIFSDSIIGSMKQSSNIQPWNGGVGDLQMKWLKENLEAAKQQNENVIVFGHHPVFPSSGHNLLNDKEIVDVFENYSCVKFYFCGHNHAGDFDEKNGIRYVTVKGMVESASKIAYSVVEITKDKIKINGFGQELDREFPF